MSRPAPRPPTVAPRPRSEACGRSAPGPATGRSCHQGWLGAGPHRPASGAALALGLALGLGTPVAFAQGFQPPAPPPPGGAAPAPKADPDAPEMHAASGGESLIPESTEPSLPAKPLEVPHRVRARIGTSFDPGEGERGREGETKRHFYGLWYDETTTGGYSFKTAFPLWFERKMPSLTKPEVTDRASLYGGLYYQRRSAEHSDDVLFPLFWNLRDHRDDSRTTVVGPYVNRRAPGETDDWLAPLYFSGTRKVGGYTVIPPLLTVLNNHARGGFNLVGPAFCSWRGGQECDTRTAQDIDYGVAPFYFYGQNIGGKYEVIPPLLHYYGYDDKDLSWTNVWGPYYRRHTQERDYLHLLPLYWSIWGEDERHTTLLPFFHYGHKGEKESLLVTPFFLNKNGAEGENTFVTWGYARYRGRTELDMVTPLYWHYRDPTIGLDQKLLFPFLFTRESPRESTFVLFPFYGHSERYAVSETTWVTPFFQHTTDLRGWSTAVHPFLYVGRNGYDTHTVVAPFFWDFASPDSRTTIGFPFYWRFADQDQLSQLVGNVYYHEEKRAHGSEWEIHVFPAFSYGETPDGHWWNVLYGLAGYTRRGEMVKMRTFWIPITVSEGREKK